MTVLNNLKKILAFCGVLIIAGAFFGLGLWQWDRAQLSRTPAVVDQTLVPLETITHPHIALPGGAALRHVSVSGKYIGDFQATKQKDGEGKSASWQVSVLETDSGAAILVARGYWDQKPSGAIDPAVSSDVTKEVVRVTGILMPHQNDDRAPLAIQGLSGSLSRIDSAVIVGATTLDLYDGFIIAESENAGAVAANRSRIRPPAPGSAVPGFYWQHISYVIIWWMMVAVALYLPLYQRFNRRSNQSRVAQESSQVESEK